jgi:ATP phosphoribosyltransferase regulatory subunit
VGFDLADLQGYAYYSGTLRGLCRRLRRRVLRGGRYDEVGAAFGRRRPAVGFSLDLKTLVRWCPARCARRDARPGAMTRLREPCGPARAGRDRGLRAARP